MTLSEMNCRRPSAISKSNGISCTLNTLRIHSIRTDTGMPRTKAKTSSAIFRPLVKTSAYKVQRNRKSASLRSRSHSTDANQQVQMVTIRSLYWAKACEASKP